MAEVLVGRRVEAVTDIECPGDYCRAAVRAKDELQDCVFFIPPNAVLDPEQPHGRLHLVRQPPHTFRECEDGSLEIRASIGCVRTPNVDPPGEGYLWHGFLDEGHRWRTA